MVKKFTSSTKSTRKKQKGSGSHKQNAINAEARDTEDVKPSVPDLDPHWQVRQEASNDSNESSLPGHVADPGDIKRAEEVSRYLLGYAALRFVGPGEINGVVNVDQNPDDRENPREVNKEHVGELFARFSSGDIMDRLFPIRIIAPADGIEEELLKKMKVVDPRNLASIIPILELKRPNAKRERELEQAILYQLNHRDERLHTASEVDDMRNELEELRKGRELARILNGNHRINAMLRFADLLRNNAMAIADAQRTKSKDLRDIRKERHELEKQVDNAAYTVEVYSADIPGYLRAWLAENDENLPNQPPNAGEKVWSTINAQEALVRHMMVDPNKPEVRTRADALNTIMDVVERKEKFDHVEGDDSSVLAFMRGLVRLKFPPKVNSSKKETPDPIYWLILNPATNAMAVDTSPASWAYSNWMPKSHIRAMRTDFGAPLIAHYWINFRLLLKITNVAHGEGLEAAEQYLNGIEGDITSPIQSQGYSEAVGHWINLHKNPQRTPTLLNQYQAEQYERFDKLTRQGLKEFRAPVKDYADPRYISALRSVFWKFGHAENGASESTRRFSVSVRLYALLPLWEEGCNNDRFFPGALLSNRHRMAQCEKSNKSDRRGRSDSPGMWVLECLLAKHQLMWTAGTVGKSATQNTRNWCGRVRGAHQLLLRLTQAVESERRDAQLQTALNIYSSPNFISSFDAIDKFLGNRIDSLKEACSVSKAGCSPQGDSTMGTYEILQTIVNRPDGAAFGSENEAREKLTNARTSLKNMLFGGDIASSIDSVLSEHNILSMLPIAWWKSVKIQEWAKGWNDAPDKRRLTTASLIGWGLATQEMVCHILPEVVRNVPEMHYLLGAVHTVHKAEQSRPWWTEQEFQIPCLSVDEEIADHGQNETTGGTKREVEEGVEEGAAMGVTQDDKDQTTTSFDINPVKDEAPDSEMPPSGSQIQDEMNHHRPELGQPLVKFVREFRELADEFSGPLEYTLAPLVCQIIALREMFITRVAQSLQTHESSVEESRDEVVAIAKSDGLYDGGVIKLNRLRGTLELDLRHALFQAARKDIGNDDTIIIENEMLRDSNNVHRTLASMRTLTCMATHDPGYPLVLVDKQGSTEPIIQEDKRSQQNGVSSMPRRPNTRFQKRKSTALNLGPRDDLPSKKARSRGLILLPKTS